MANLENISTEDLRQILAEVDNGADRKSVV